MTNIVASEPQVPGYHSPQPPNILDEERWQAWVRKGIANDRRGAKTRLKVMQYASIFTLLATAAFWSFLPPYGIVVWSIVTVSAVGLLWQALRERSYVLAAVFAALAVLYNPVFPLFALAGDWQRILAVVSVAPFLLSMGWSRQGKRDA